jgi:anti-sigma factor RsiW
MKGFARHLHDDRLYECYVAEQTGDPIDPRAAEHMADCSACRARYTELAAVMGAFRADADAEIDALYSPEDLRRQQSQIARHLEHLGHAARVISFPHHHVTGTPGQGWGVAPRWLAAAAAAGLIVGVAASSVFQHLPVAPRHTARVASTAVVPAARITAPQPAVTVTATAPGSTVDTDPNDEFLSELEFALERPRTSELEAFDELTPHAHEISLNSRIQ